MTRVRIGVVGCGAVAQIQHLPFLAELSEEFELAAVCDVSPSAAKYAAELFHVPNRYTDYRDLLASDVDAVLLCQTDPKTEVATAALDAGKHMFIEKPVCLSLDDVEKIIAAAEKAGVVAQAGYVKLYEPAFEAAVPEVRNIEDVHFVQVNHLHPDNSLHIGQFRTRRFDDVPAALGEQLADARSASIRSAIGDVPPRRAGVHDAVGQPDTRPLRSEAAVRTAAVGPTHGYLERGSGGQHDARIPLRLPVRGVLDRSAEALGLLRDAGGVRVRKARGRAVRDRLLKGSVHTDRS